MEGSLLRCQPVSWIKMTHLFTQEPHKVLFLTGRGACRRSAEGVRRICLCRLPGLPKVIIAVCGKPSAGYRPPLSG